MKKRKLEEKLARLESANDQLVSELTYINDLMMSIGFTYGLVSVKAVAKELLKSFAPNSEEKN